MKKKYFTIYIIMHRALNVILVIIATSIDLWTRNVPVVSATDVRSLDPGHDSQTGKSKLL